MIYINMKSSTHGTETVDEFKKYAEARKMLKEYILSDTYNTYYLSQRCCKGWNK